MPLSTQNAPPHDKRHSGKVKDLSASPTLILHFRRAVEFGLSVNGKPRAGSNPAQSDNRLIPNSLFVRRSFHRAECRRLPNSMVEFRPRAGVAGSTPASDAVSCPMAFVGRAPAPFDGSQDWVIAHNDVVAGSSPASGTKCRSSSVVEHVIPSSSFIRRYSSAGRRLWVLVNPVVAVQFRPAEHSAVV